MKKLCAVIISILFLASCNRGSQESVLLRLKYSDGDYQIMNFKMKAAGGGTDLETESEMYFVVDSVINKGEEYRFSTRLNYIKFRTADRISVDYYDSRTSEENMREENLEIHAGIKPMLRNKMWISINNRGEITDHFKFENGERIEEASQPIDMSHLLIKFPKEPVSEGFSWEVERTNPITKGKIITQYTIKQITKETITISAEALVGGIKNLTRDNKADGKYIIDRKTGRLITGKLVMELEAGFGEKSKVTILTESK